MNVRPASPNAYDDIIFDTVYDLIFLLKALGRANKYG